MKLSDLIRKLKDLQNEVGDVEVYCGGEDYPGRVKWVGIKKRGDGYIPKGKVHLVGGI